MKVLVTGATGLIGNNVVRHLLDDDDPPAIRCLVRGSSDPRPLAGLPVEIATVDVTDAVSLERAADGVDAVIHCAGEVYIGWSRLEPIRAANVDGTRAVAAAARKAGARLIHVSTIDVLRSERFAAIPYVATKKAAETAVAAEIDAGLDAVIIRPAFVLGPHDWKPSSGRVFVAAATRWIPFAPRGSLSLCDVRDVAAAIATAVREGQAGAAYALGGHEMRWIDALRRFADMGGRWAPICRFDPVANRLIGLAGDLIGRIRGSEPEINSALIKLNEEQQVRDEAARAELAYRNRPLQETLNDTWRWFQRRENTIS